jgi:hypothetical protein
MATPFDIDGETVTKFQTGNGSVGTAAVQLYTTPGLVAKKYVRVKSNAANTGKLYVGSNALVAANNGYQLAPGEYVDIKVIDPSFVWLISDTAAQTFSWLFV